MARPYNFLNSMILIYFLWHNYMLDNCFKYCMYKGVNSCIDESLYSS